MKKIILVILTVFLVTGFLVIDSHADCYRGPRAYWTGPAVVVGPRPYPCYYYSPPPVVVRRPAPVIYAPSPVVIHQAVPVVYSPSPWVPGVNVFLPGINIRIR